MLHRIDLDVQIPGPVSIPAHQTIRLWQEQCVGPLVLAAQEVLAVGKRELEPPASLSSLFSLSSTPPCPLVLLVSKFERGWGFWKTSIF